MNRLSLPLLFALPLLATAELRVHPLSDSVVAFSGATHSVSVLVSNTTDAPFRSHLRARLYQIAQRLSVPVESPQDFDGPEMSPKQVVLRSLTVTLPETRAVTRFRLRFADSGGKFVGEVPLTVIPANLVRESIGSRPVHLYDPLEKVGPLLRHQNIETHPLPEHQEAEPNPRNPVIAWLATGKSDDNRRVLRLLLSRSEAGAGVVCLVEAGALENEPIELPVILHKGRGGFVLAPAAALGPLAESAAAQWKLAQYLVTALSPTPLSID